MTRITEYADVTASGPAAARGAGLLVLLLSAALFSQAKAQESRWVQTGVTGGLIYAPDAEGDRIADFSMAGYGAGKRSIPDDIPVLIHIDPLLGDNTQHIQSAINFASSQPLQANGFRGIVELGPGKFDVNGHLSITTSGVVLRGSGGGDGLASNTHIVSQNRTDSIASASTPVINIQGSSSGITRGPQIQILDKRVPVGAQSFRVASTAGMAVGGMVEIFRPSTQAWIEELGMHLIPDGKEWHAGDRDLVWQRTIYRIEGNRVFIDAPITTALDTQWGGGTVRTFSAPNIIRNVGVENLRGQSLDTREESNEQRTPSFVRFTRVDDGFVRDVETRHFSYASVFASQDDGTQHITVDNVTSWLPSGQVTGGRRYTFAMDAQMSLVKNSHADAGRHDFVTGSDVTGPIVFYNSTTSGTRADAGPHHRWGNGLLFDNITVGGNALNVQNRWTSGSGHGWAGANVVVWNSQANSFIVQSPPTAQSWLIGSTGTINAGNCHLGSGVSCAGYYDSHGTRVTVGGAESLYEAQVNDAAEVRDFHWTGGNGLWSSASQWDQSLTPGVYRVSQRDYLVGDIDQFLHDGAGSVDNAYIDPNWASSIQQGSDMPITGFDDLAGNKNVAFTIQHQLDTGERVVHAFLAMSLKRGAAGSAANDFVRLFDDNPTHQFTFNQLGWASQVNASTPFVGVVDMGSYLDNLQSGAVNVHVANQTGVDWAMYVASVATPLSDPAGARVFLDGGGRTILDHVAAAVGSVQIGGGGNGLLRLGYQALLPVTSNLGQSSNGTLQVEIGGTAMGQFGRLQIGGQAQLGGALQVTLVNGFIPAAGQNFQFLNAAGGISQSFQQLLLPTLAPGLQWNLTYGSRSLLLHVVSAVLPGDYNRDGQVDAADYIVWRKSAGQQVPSGTGADGNSDGWVDDGDLFVWRSNFGKNVGGGASSTTDGSGVPEPSTVLSVMLAVSVSLLARIKRMDY